MRVFAPIDKLHSWLAPSQLPKYGAEGNSLNKFMANKSVLPTPQNHLAISVSSRKALRIEPSKNSVKTQSDALSKFVTKG